MPIPVKYEHLEMRQLLQSKSKTILHLYIYTLELVQHVSEALPDPQVPQLPL